MGKALLVMEDMHPNCAGCPCYSSFYCYCNVTKQSVLKAVTRGTKPDWCPLIPMPEKPDIPLIGECSHVAGWNDCIDAICAESEKENKGVITHKCRMNTCSIGHSGNT